MSPFLFPCPRVTFVGWTLVSPGGPSSSSAPAVGWCNKELIFSRIGGPPSLLIVGIIAGSSFFPSFAMDAFFHFRGIGFLLRGTDFLFCCTCTGFSICIIGSPNSSTIPTFTNLSKSTDSGSSSAFLAFFFFFSARVGNNLLTATFIFGT